MACPLRNSRTYMPSWPMCICAGSKRWDVQDPIKAASTWDEEQSGRRCALKEESIREICDCRVVACRVHVHRLG